RSADHYDMQGGGASFGDSLDAVVGSYIARVLSPVSEFSPFLDSFSFSVSNSSRITAKILFNFSLCSSVNSLPPQVALLFLSSNASLMSTDCFLDVVLS